MTAAGRLVASCSSESEKIEGQRAMARVGPHSVLSSEGPHEEDSMASMYDFEMTSITGEQVSLADYQGQVCLVVNVASA